MGMGLLSVFVLLDHVCFCVYFFVIVFFAVLRGFRCLWSPGCCVGSLSKRGKIGKMFTALYRNLVCISVDLVSRTHMRKIRISLGGGIAYVLFFFFFFFSFGG
jgi:hypothetical protein